MHREAPTRAGLLVYATHVGRDLGEGGLRLYFRMPADPARPATPREVRRLEKAVEAETARQAEVTPPLGRRRGRPRGTRTASREPIITRAQVHPARQAAARRRRSTVGRQKRGRVYLLAQLLHCSCGLRMHGETQVRAGRAEEWRYYRCPGRRDGRCSSGGWRVRADEAEGLVLGHLAAHRTPPEELPYLREELSPDASPRRRPAREARASRRR